MGWASRCVGWCGPRPERTYFPVMNSGINRMATIDIDGAAFDVEIISAQNTTPTFSLRIRYETGTETGRDALALDVEARSDLTVSFIERRLRSWLGEHDEATITAFEIVEEAVERVSDDVGFEVRFGLDVAAAELYDPDDEVYRYSDTERTPDEQVDYVAGLVSEYDLVYVEDPLDEDAYDDFAALTDRVGDRTLVCGDDLFVTDVDRLERGPVGFVAGERVVEQVPVERLAVRPPQLHKPLELRRCVSLCVEKVKEAPMFVVPTGVEGPADDSAGQGLKVGTLEPESPVLQKPPRFNGVPRIEQAPFDGVEKLAFRRYVFKNQFTVAVHVEQHPLYALTDFFIPGLPIVTGNLLNDV